MKLIKQEQERKIYDMENGYIVSKEICTWNSIGYRLFIRTMNQQYFPEIFYNSDMSTFEIQTTGYGALIPDDITKVIEGYKTAIKSIEVIKTAIETGEL